MAATPSSPSASALSQDLGQQHVLMQPNADSCMSNPDPDLLDERALSKLKWRCRRGLLENDLLIQRFFGRHEAALTVRQAKGLNRLMDLSDNDLLDLLLKRKEPDQLPEAESQAAASTPEALEVLHLLRPASGSARLLSSE
jgi:antitoxin CptB